MTDVTTGSSGSSGVALQSGATSTGAAPSLQTGETASGAVGLVVPSWWAGVVCFGAVAWL